MVASHEDMGVTLQAAVYYILTNDSTVTSLVTAGGTRYNIYDGTPWRSGRTGYPFILIKSPEFDGSRITITQFNYDCSVIVEIYGKKEGDVRKVSDAVRQAMASNETYTEGKGFYTFIAVDSSLSETFLEGENEPVWLYSLVFSYDWSRAL